MQVMLSAPDHAALLGSQNMCRYTLGFVFDHNELMKGNKQMTGNSYRYFIM